MREAIGAVGAVDWITVLGSRIAVKRWGEGRPVLALHAAGHGGGDFALLAERIADPFEVIALDWPGQGRSPADDGNARAGRYADLALAACDELGLDRPLVIGNSIGGAAAIVAAAKAPDRFAAMVLCNPGGLAPLDPAARFVIERMAGFFDAGARGAAWFPAAFAAYYRTCVLTGAPAAGHRRRIVAAGRELAPLLADAWRGFAQPDADLRALAPTVRIPVWLAWAKRDAFVSWTRSKAAALTFPAGRLTLFAASHAPFLEAPDAFAAQFLRFASEVGEPDRR